MIRSTVNIVEMKRACNRLLARLPDERDSGNSSVLFTADHDSLHIQIGDSSEIVPAIVAEAGVESLMFAVLWHGSNSALLPQKEN